MPAPRFSSFAAFVLLTAGPGAAVADRPDPVAGGTTVPDLVALVKAYLGMALPADWSAIESLPGSTWAPLPPTSLTNCLPNGDCFVRQGTVALGGRSHPIVATGARTMVVTLLIRNQGPSLGGAGLLAGLKEAGLEAGLARCPIDPRAAATSWYRLSGGGLAPAVLAIQPPTAGRPGEGFVITQGSELPALQPSQLAHFTEQCAAGAERKPVATTRPHEQLADAVVALLAAAGTGGGGYDWSTLRSRATGIEWNGTAPAPADLSSRGDRNPVMMTGSVGYAGRKFSALASGTPARVKTIYLEELGLHPRGEHLLGVVHGKGIAVRLVRCGPVYTESTNNWYGMTSARTHPASIRQSIRHDGGQVQDAYEIRLDGSLPTRDPRDRDPGSNGC